MPKQTWKHPNRRVIYVDDATWKKAKALARHRLISVSELIRNQLAVLFGDESQ